MRHVAPLRFAPAFRAPIEIPSLSGGINVLCAQITKEGCVNEEFLASYSSLYSLNLTTSLAPLFEVIAIANYCFYIKYWYFHEIVLSV